MKKIKFQEVHEENNKKSRLSEATYISELSGLMRHIHSAIPKCNADTYHIAAFDEREEVFRNQNCKRAVMYLRSNGCEWALKSGNGCTMCGHLSEQIRTEEPLTDEEYLSQFVLEYKKIDFKEYPILNLYNNGSFFNDNEISEYCRAEIMKLIGSNEKIKMVVFETRPEFVSLEILKKIKEYMPNTYVEIAIGLESYSDEVRLLCVNKGFTLKTYEKAAKIIVNHGGANIKLRSYVLLKPPFLSEKEAIEDAVRTIKYCFEIGCTTVSLEGCTIQKYTLPDFLHEKDAYRTPWLWSIIEVLKQTYNLGTVIIGLFDFFPTAMQVPHNCEICSEKIRSCLKEYNRLLDIKVFEEVECSCKTIWKQNLQLPVEDMNKRIEDALEEFSIV